MMITDNSAPFLIADSVEESPDRVIYVHGTMDTGRSFVEVAACSGIRSFTYDRRGWGSRRDEETVDVESEARTLTELVNAVDATCVVGHSYGGLIALLAANRYGSSVKSLVVFEPPVRWLPWWPGMGTLELCAQEASESGPVAIARQLQAVVLGCVPDDLNDASQPEQLAIDGEHALAEMSHGLMSSELFDVLKLEQRTTVVSGSHSFPEHIAVADNLALCLPNGSRRQISGAGHLPHITHPDDLAGIIRSSLATQ